MQKRKFKSNLTSPDGSGPVCSFITDAMSNKALSIVHNNLTLAIQNPSLPLADIIDMTVPYPTGASNNTPIIKPLLHEEIVRKLVALSDELLKKVSHKDSANAIFQVASSLLFIIFIVVGAMFALKFRSLLQEAEKGPQEACTKVASNYPHIEDIELVPITGVTPGVALSLKGH